MTAPTSWGVSAPLADAAARSRDDGDPAGEFEIHGQAAFAGRSRGATSFA